MYATAQNSHSQQRTEGTSRINNQKLASAKHFIELLDKVPSHYCRQSTSYSCLWQDHFKSAADVHRQYIAYMTEHHPNQPCLQCSRFKSLLQEEKVKIWQPRKDRCDTCMAHAAGNVQKEVYERHIHLKNSARKRKTGDIARAKESNGKVVCISIDVQAVQTCPKLEASALYFKTKLNIHNYTVYNSNTSDVLCYIWNETQGGLTANIYTSCLIHYLDSICDPISKVEEILVWSDGCGSQNRNCTLVSCISTWAKSNKKSVFFNYPEKCHTQMEVYSVHATIETLARKSEIHVPADYCKIVQAARHKKPYQINYLSYPFFKDYGKGAVFDTIRPGTRVGSPHVADIRQIRCSNDGTVCYKLSHEDDDEFVLLPHRRKNDPTTHPDQLYNGPIPIQTRKWKDLQDLKSVIHPEHHGYYDNLPHEPS